jgi:CBS domain containing-hemolysin-like protein
LEELVGEIADEHDRRDESLIVLDDNTALADARLHTEDLEQLWGISLPVGDLTPLAVS